MENRGVSRWKTCFSDLEDSAKARRQNGQRVFRCSHAVAQQVFRCSQLPMLPMHAWGGSADHQRVAFRCRSADYVPQFWLHAIELGRRWRSAVKSLIIHRKH
jgi:hypothetical protein